MKYTHNIIKAVATSYFYSSQFNVYFISPRRAFPIFIKLKNAKMINSYGETSLMSNIICLKNIKWCLLYRTLFISEHLAGTGVTYCSRNQIITNIRLLFNELDKHFSFLNIIFDFEICASVIYWLIITFSNNTFNCSI